MPVEHDYWVWGAVSVLGPLAPECVRAKNDAAAAATYAKRNGVKDGRTITVVRRKRVSQYVKRTVVEPA